MSLKKEKMITFDADGNPKEIRFYEDDELSARLGVILDADKNFIGLRELEVEEVIPSSWLDRFRRRKARPSPITISTIDFIGLINWINTIKTIKKIENIDLIDRITLIDQITKIGEITTIRDIIFPPPTFFCNPSWDADFLGWDKTGTVEIVTSPIYLAGKAVKFTANIAGSVYQRFFIPLGVAWLSALTVWVRATATGSVISVYYWYTDGTTGSEILSISIANTWEKKTLSPTTGKYIEAIQFLHGSAYTMNVYLDTILTVF